MKLIGLSSGQRQSSKNEACLRGRGRQGSQEHLPSPGEERNGRQFWVRIHAIFVVSVILSAKKIFGAVFWIVQADVSAWIIGLRVSLSFSAGPTCRRCQEAKGGTDDGQDAEDGSWSQSQLPAMI